MGSVDDQKPRSESCNKFHFGECRKRSGACYRYGSLDHFLKDCPERVDKGVDLAPNSNAPNSRGRPPRHPGIASDSRNVARDTTVKPETRALIRTYAIQAKEKASAPDVITEPKEFVIKVSNPLGKSVLVDKVYKNCPLTIQGHRFLDNLMLFPFNEFYVILGKDWLILYDVIVNCGNNYIELKCSNGEVL
ncbi:uncharacterized protein LOC108477844 [Gossypium arboreum]|uniref:uncharacterized protein LOC108477844 n=1 Tax=Gossypium arboreum TaxID=29729 RepID=UPI000818F777|nr:uncharacterized protein LOC108477844 [Gossypium arboreum]